MIIVSTVRLHHMTETIKNVVKFFGDIPYGLMIVSFRNVRKADTIIDTEKIISIKLFRTIQHCGKTTSYLSYKLKF